MEKNVGIRPRVALPIVVLICGLGATALATYLINENLRFKRRERLNEAANHVERTIQSRMEAYVGLLRGGAALFAASEAVTKEEFTRFVSRLEIDTRYPGLQGYGYAARVKAGEIDSVTATMRNQGLTNFQVWPTEPAREEYYSILYLEPMDERNRRALGFDMFSEPVRRAAMEAARDFGNPRFSRMVKLVQEKPEEPGQPGVLLYLPIYAQGQIPETLEERREKLLGFIYSPFRAGDLFHGIVPGMPAGLAFAIWDGSEPKPEALLHRSDPGFYLDGTNALHVLEIPGAVWSMAVSELAGYEAGPTEQLLWMLPVLGSLASGFLSYSIFAQGRARSQSEQSAYELFEERERLQVTLGSIGDGVISTDRSGRIQFMNGIERFPKKISD